MAAPSQVERLTAVAARGEDRLAAGAAAGFVSRSLAMAIDIAAIAGVTVMASVFGAAIQVVLPKWSWLATAVPAAVAVFSSLVPLLYFVVLIAVTGRTIGKSFMGIRVVRADGRRLSVTRSFVRTVGYVVSLLPLFAGFVWVLFDRDRRAWHDHIAGSRVVYEPQR